MTTKHTPGPWEVKEVNNAKIRGALHIFAAGFPGSLICEDVYGKTLEQSDANRALIAAAPDMLIALQTIALHAHSLDAQGIRELCDAAIAKAQVEA